MPSKARNIVLALTLLLLLPAILLVYREASTQNQFEDTLTELYQERLDAVLFSVNQYSQDLTENWAKKLEIQEAPDSLFFQYSRSISQIIIADSIDDPNPKTWGPETPMSLQNAKDFFIQENKSIKRLSGYLSANYRKLEPKKARTSGDIQGILCMLEKEKSPPKPCFIILDQESFIKNDLRPRLEVLAREDLDFFVWKANQKKPVVATDTVSNVNILEQKPLWLLPDHRMAISLRGGSLSTIIQERSKLGLWLMIGLSLFALAGVFWIFRIIQKEIQLAQTKSDFVSNVSHEIRTPLSLISMFAETLMLKRVPTEERKETYYKIIFQESKRLTGLVNKILNFSQMEAGLRTYQLEAVDLNTIVKEIWEAYEFHLTQHGFKADLSIFPKPLIIKADQEAISEAVINLLDNAMKYSPDTKAVSLSTGAKNSEAWIEVSDKGMGIPSEQQDKIFEKFHRVASGPVHNTKGTGLGLTLLKRIIDAHDGRIEVKSKEGAGSAFRLIFKQKD